MTLPRVRKEVCLCDQCLLEFGSIENSTADEELRQRFYEWTHLVVNNEDTLTSDKNRLLLWSQLAG